MAQPAYVIAQHSYARCLRSSDFFAVLYDHLLGSDPRIPPMFEETAFPRQHKLLQHGIGLLLSYARNPDDALLERIAARHSAQGIDVPPEMYEHFVSSLMTAVQETDPRFDGEVEAAWQEAVEPGLTFMKDRYDR
ncbi:MAG: globin [Longimicrobiales bacterium]|nr:globin [Longimicrobiales bacterium]